MPTATLQKPSTPASTISSVAPSNTNGTAIQSGPYTKAQFQSTMEGSRSVKNIKEVEQLLHDYPAALDLYRTGKYKVKVKYEADVERVILVEKRTSKSGTSTNTTTNSSQRNQSPDVLSTNEKSKQETTKENISGQSRSRTHSRDRVTTHPANNTTMTTSTNSNSGGIVHTTTSSIRLASNTQPKVDHHRTPSKEREISVSSEQKQQQQQQQQQHAHRRDHSRDSPHTVPINKHQGNRTNRDYPKMMVPFVPNTNGAITNPNLWPQTRAIRPYLSNPLLQQQQQRQNIYMTSNFVPQHVPNYRQPFFFPQRPGGPPLVYQQQQTMFPGSSSGKPNRNVSGITSLQSAYQHPSSRSVLKSSQGVGLPPSFHTFHANQQQQHPTVPPPPPPPSFVRPMYQSQPPVAMTHPWPMGTVAPAGNMNPGTLVDPRQGAKHRARSMDTGPHGPAPLRPFIPQQQQQQQQQQQPVEIVEQHHHHHHHHHHHRPQPANVTTNGYNAPSAAEKVGEISVPPKESTTAANGTNGGQKLTIRQLNETFIQMDSTGRLPYSSLPGMLQRFGITLTENELISAARELHYNVTEPISARRLVYVLVKLGKIAKSNHHPRPTASPSMLPEDREVTDIMMQRRVNGVVSTHVHSSINPNHWY